MKHKSYDITLSREVLIFLQENTATDGNRFSKLDAYVHLLESVRNFESKFIVSGESMTLRKGQLVTSYSELADQWKWSRSNVKAFIESLVELKALTAERVGKKLLVTLPLLFKGDITPVRLLSPEEQSCLRFILGILSVDEFFIMFDRAMGEMENNLTLCGDTQQDRPLGNRLRRLVDHLVLHASNFAVGTAELHEALEHLFTIECGRDLMLFLSLLSFGSVADINENLGVTIPFQISDDARRNLDIVIAHYSKWLGREVPDAHPSLPPVPD